MGSREVLGQAARLASSGLLLQVFCPAVSRPTRSPEARGGGPGALESALRGTPSPGVDPHY